MSRGSLFVVTGPSGAGKGTVLGKVRGELDRLHYSVSLTTRPPREGEEHGVHYHFCSPDEAMGMIASGRMLEHAEYVGNIYGTPEAPVEAALDAGLDVILEIEVQGALQIKAKRPDATLVFVAPPSFEELERRLRGRGTESDEKIASRLNRARDEQKKVGEFHYIVLNDDADLAAAELRAIIIAQRCTLARRADVLPG